MIKRKIYQKILRWKESTNGTKALLIEGARRIGKSTIAEEFGKKEYKSYILIDFNKATKKTMESFEDLNNLDVFFQTIMLEYNTRLFERESLIIFDEIQKFPKAREAVKYLVADGRYDYIETGSLISIRENVDNITIPSEERKIKMFPVDFEEFMLYMNEELLLEYIKKCLKMKQPLDQKMHQKAMHIFKEYMLVGGMPQAVVAFKENARDFVAADIEKRDILSLYRDDIKKAAKRYNSRVSAIFENIPAYLSTHEKRVVLSEIESNATFAQYDDPFFWLDDSMICNLCYKCNDPNVGFSLNKNESFVKCYMGDTGLLVSLAFNENEIMEQQLYKQIMNEKLSLNQGMIYENMISQMIVAMGRKLYFYTRYNEEKHRNDIEIDFLLSNESKMNFRMYPIEVKSSKNYSAISLDKFKELYEKKIAISYIVHPKNLLVDGEIIKIPPYMFPFVFEV
ncbi:MAG: AAA family ATPase [Clostridium sp.]|nr:AAA family ATPase [Clostridium sp.]